MPRSIRRGFLLALIGIGAFLAGCGRTIGSPGSPQTGAFPTATPGASPSETLTGGQVTLTLDKQRYLAGDTIAVTLHNGLSQTIWAADHRTDCTVVTAERQQDGQWQGLQNCRLMTPTVLVPLSAGSASVQMLSTQGPWPAGTYRVTLTYTSGDEGTGGPGGVAHSAAFTIG
jgi:hypothetical protein